MASSPSSSLYRNVVPLNREHHRKLRLRTERRSGFAAAMHYVPLAAIELYEAAKDYPIVFAGGDDASPAAILGLRSGENLFVDANGRWADYTYVPAFIRRYPFILSRGGQEGSDYTVCVDESYEGLSETEGTPLFDENGKESELVGRIVGLLQDLLTEAERTRRFVERLRALELLTVQSIQVQDGAGRTFALRDFRIVDENKLKALDNEVLGELNRSGYLGCIYAHIVSLGNLPRLAARVPAGEPGGTGGGAGAGPSETGAVGGGTGAGGDTGAA